MSFLSFGILFLFCFRFFFTFIPKEPLFISLFGIIMLKKKVFKLNKKRQKRKLFFHNIVFAF